jgi:arsenate reductase (thioredoxin)
MKFSFPGESKSKQKKTTLFVCVENAGRSQMAEGFFRKYAPQDYEPISAGTRPSGEINPLAIEVMKEAGIDISKQKSKEITEDMMRNSAQIVNIGCMEREKERESCPSLFIHNLIDWGIEDPKGKPIEKVREIRDEIERRVRELAAELNKQDIKESK